MNIKETLDNLYDRIVGLEHKQVAYSLYDIIQLKMVAPELVNYNNTFYKDIKGFIHHYILAVELEGYGYDSVSINKVLDAIRFANSTSKCKITKCFCKSTPLVLRNSISFLVSH